MAKNIQQLTSREAVLQSVAECDRLGRETFLAKYGYRPSRKYVLRFQGNEYDSKAIVGIAYGKQHGTPLRANQFSGGVGTVIPILRSLGFDASEAVHPALKLEVDKIYSRTSLLEAYGGQIQR